VASRGHERSTNEPVSWLPCLAGSVLLEMMMG